MKNKKGKSRAIAKNQNLSPKKDSQLISGKAIKWILPLILLITYISFSPSLNNDFTNWDDSGYVSDNKIIRDLSWESMPVFFTEEVQANYHPLTMLSLALDYKFYKLNPKGYHITNVFFHLLNTVLVFWIFWLLAGNVLTAAITALLFGIHPMHVESVAWVSERKDVLYSFFYLGALIAYYYYAIGKKQALNYSLCLILFILSCFSKGMAVSLPVLLLAIDYFIKREWSIKIILEKIPLLIISLIFGVIAIIYQKGAIHDPELFVWYERLMFSSYGMLVYLVKAFIPYELSSYYPYPVKATGDVPGNILCCSVFSHYHVLFFL